MNSNLQEAIANRNILKIISGINNFDITKVLKITKAAEQGGATYIDVAANDVLVKTVRRNSTLPICVSSINPDLIYRCINNGANLIEIGNYDLFYKRGFFFTAERILDLTKQLSRLFPEISLCVTVPHYLSIPQQVYLAQKLEGLGVDMLQTEGISSYQHYSLINNNIATLIEKVTATLSTTYAVSNAVSVPLITASGISDLTGPIAIQYGASGIGVGNAISQLNDIDQMISSIRVIKGKLRYNSNKVTTYGQSLIFFDQLSKLQQDTTKDFVRKPLVK